MKIRNKFPYSVIEICISMDTKSKFSTFFFFLMMAVLLLSGVSTSNTISFGSDQQSSLCKNAHLTSLVNGDQPFEVKKGGEGATPSQGATPVSSSCSISLHVIPVKKLSLGSPKESSLTFSPYTSVIPSQAFVYQEPNPPQTV